MRVKLQLVMCNDAGQEETVTDVITLNKNSQRIEHLGSAIPGQKSASNMLDQWNCRMMPLSLPKKGIVVGG